MDDQVDAHEQPLAAYLIEQVGAATEHLDEVPEERAIHQTRVALRRVRSSLRVFGDLLTLSDEENEAVDTELRWLAGVLGEVRDRQVQRSRFVAVLAVLPPEDVSDESVLRVATLIEQTLLGEERIAARRVEEMLTTERYRAIRTQLEAWRVRPPVVTADSTKARHREVRKAAKAAAKKAEKRLAAAVDGTDDEELHRARKASKRARYAAEVLRPLSRGEDQRAHYKGMQEVLGDFQDAVVAQGTIRRLADTIDDAECAFVLGLLYAQAREQAAERRHQARTLLR